QHTAAISSVSLHDDLPISKFNFNSAGRLTSIVDRNNNTTTFGYDGSNRLSTITDFNNLVTNLAYNAAGRVSTITDPATRVTTLGYNASNQLTSITDPDNAAMGYGYDTSGRMTSLTDPRTNVYNIVYTFARVPSITRPSPGGGESFPAYRVVATPPPPAGTSQQNAAAPTLAVATFATYTDPRTNQWKSYLDWLGMGQVQQAQDPLTNMAVGYLDANGLPWLSADPLGRRNRSFFDSKANPTKIVLPDDAFAQATFNSFSEPLTITDAKGNVTTLQYDGTGNLTQRTDPDPDGGGPLTSPITTMTYTPKGFVQTITDPLTHVTTLGPHTPTPVTTPTDSL